ncbi:uncharacterized protein [Spinacia oleracea]|uniref:Integrase catalytic domain-containing protein n=1 Tax=Spinacia oleracea TaxID=3562 RepID=A0ABM3QXH1_SPIOL|nr:uncharacterized protein LOC110777294 [Spinacia oleracea]
MTTIETTSPLYLHPSDGSSSINIEKLQGSSNYMSWRRSFEISLGAKRKHGFVTGVVKQDPSDSVKQDHWDTCNNMVISWIMFNVTGSIKKSIMFVTNSATIWKQLEQRYTMSNGSRKYKICKDIYETKQQGALNQQREEQKLFQILNGLDDGYNARRSQLLMMTPLPTVDSACSCLQQEESQRDIRHTKETCWFIVGYPSWHPLGKKESKGKGKDSSKHQGRDYSKTSYNHFKGGQKWNKGNGGSKNRMVANAHTHNDVASSSTKSTFTTQQLEQLLKMLHVPSKATPGSDTKDEMDTGIAGMVSCYYANAIGQEWIIDTGASLHMTGNLNMLLNSVKCDDFPQINFPTGKTSDITHTEIVKLHNHLQLNNLLCVPAFKHNLLVITLGRVVNGLYYLVNEPTSQAMRHITKSVGDNTVAGCKKTAMTTSGDLVILTTVRDTNPMNATTLWHHRLGHAPVEKINKIQGLKGFNTKCIDVKSDAYEALRGFVKMVKTQFQKIMKKVRSDNSLEFDDKLCMPFFSELGITHQTSWVGRPQLNGRVERKHRNILEMGRAHRFQVGLPL